MTEDDTFNALRKVSSIELYRAFINVRTNSPYAYADEMTWYETAQRVLKECGWTQEEYIAHTLKITVPFSEVFYISKRHKSLYDSHY